MRHVRLTAKTKKGKTRIGASGNVWAVIEGAVEALTPPPVNALFIRSLDGRDWRWVTRQDDPNFGVEEV